MGAPRGAVVARPLVARACGCVQEFQHVAGDRYRDQRLAKFTSTRCQPCAARAAEEVQREAAAVAPRVGAFARLPAGASLTLTLRPDGVWAGALAAGGRAVEATAGGLEGVSLELARRWAAAAGPGPTSV